MEHSGILRKNLKLALNFKPFHAGEMDALRQKARGVAGDGRFERYKTTQQHTGSPAGRWLASAPQLLSLAW